MPKYLYTVTIDTDTQNHADIVITARLGYDKEIDPDDGGPFVDYKIAWYGIPPLYDMLPASTKPPFKPTYDWFPEKYTGHKPWCYAPGKHSVYLSDCAGWHGKVSTAWQNDHPGISSPDDLEV